jgi:YD repeat-containing protein
MAYLKTGNSEDLAPLEMFLQANPNSRWRVSLLTNMGLVYRRTGYFTKALSAWEEAWASGKSETAPAASAIADRAVAEWAELNARVGRMDVLEPLFKELEGREIGGSPSEKLRGAKQGLWLMQNKPEDAFRCGPFALDRILAFESGANYKQDERIHNSRSTIHGMSLTEVWKLSEQLQMNLQMAVRVGDADFLMPALIHWKAGHYAALLKQENGHYLVRDPTFGDEFWVSRTALNREASGYFLVRNGDLPEGWIPAKESEGDRIWGKGNTGTSDLHAIKPWDLKCIPCLVNQLWRVAFGMAAYDVHLMLVNLNITDIPLRYAPPRGPTLGFEVTYNQKESFQPSIFTYSNLGPKWTFDWMSYVKDDPSNPGATGYVYVRGGGEETYTGYNSTTQSYAPQLESHAVLVRTSTSPIQYERRLPDGSVEVFGQPDGAATFPRRIFMTQWKDPAGNAVTYTYDSSLRLVAVTDAIGQVTTLSYQLTSDPLKITSVTDPFGRSAIFDYTLTGRLMRITDVIGIQSSFSYGTADFISSMTTPCGTTSFVYIETDAQTLLLLRCS